MRVLAVAAHPDDLELLCAGTLVRYIDAGNDVVMCHVSTGNRGSYEIPSQELAVLRIAEAQRAAAIAGAVHETFGYGDGEVSASDMAHRKRMVELIRQTRPDLIITHFPQDYQVDHEEVSRLVFDASFYASVPQYLPEAGEATDVTPIYYMEPIGGLGFTPSEWVDISDVMPRKIDILNEHKTQLKWLSEHDGDDVVERMVTTARYRGFQAGVRYAETFTPCLRWMRPRTRRLLP